jgi:hypothetical protein
MRRFGGVGFGLRGTAIGSPIGQAPDSRTRINEVCQQYHGISADVAAAVRTKFTIADPDPGTAISGTDPGREFKSRRPSYGKRRNRRWPSHSGRSGAVVRRSAGDGGHFYRHRDNINAGAQHRRFAGTINLNKDYDGSDLIFPEFGRRFYRAPHGDRCRTVRYSFNSSDASGGVVTKQILDNNDVRQRRRPALPELGETLRWT